MSFVYDNSSLNGAKVNRGPLPGGEDPNKWIQANEDWNPTVSAIYDLRTGIINNLFLGVARQAVQPTVPVSGAVDYLWANNSGDLYWHKNGVGNQQLNTASGGSSNVFFWDDVTTWDTLWTQIVLAGSRGLILLPPSSYRVITTFGNPYDFTNIRFIGIGPFRAIMDLDPGVHIDGGAIAMMDVENIFLSGQAPLMTSTTKDVWLRGKRSLISNYGSATPLFSTSSSDIYIQLENSTLENDAGGTAVVHMTTAGARTVVESFASFPQDFPTIQGANFVITGVAGTNFAVIAEPLSAADIQKKVGPGVTLETLSRQYGQLSFPQLPTGSLPTANVFNKGQVVYDTTAGAPKYSDGAAWQTFDSTAGDFPFVATVGTWNQGVITNPGTNAIFLEYTPSDAGTTHWYQSAASFANAPGPRRNQTMNIGWNLGPGGGRQTAGALNGAIGWSLEQYYETVGPNKVMEFHQIYVSPADVQTRITSALCNLEAPYNVGLYIYSDSVVIGHGKNNNDPPHILIDSTTTHITAPAGYGSLLLDDGGSGVTLQNGGGGNPDKGHVVINSAGQVNIDSEAFIRLTYNSAVMVSVDNTQVVLTSQDGTSASVQVGNGTGPIMYANGNARWLVQDTQVFASAVPIVDQRNGGGTSTTVIGFETKNDANATNGNQQWSPSLYLRGSAFVSIPANSQQAGYMFQTQTVQGTSAPSADLSIGLSLNDATPSEKLKLKADGSLLVAGMTLENLPSFGSPQIHGTALNDYMTFSSDGVGPNWGGTGMTCRQDSGTPSVSDIVFAINDNLILVMFDRGLFPNLDSTYDLGGNGAPGSFTWRDTWSTNFRHATTVSLLSSAADGASAVAAKVNTTTAWTNATAKLLSLRNNSVEKAYFNTNGDAFVGNGGLALENTAGFGSPVIRGTAANGFVTIASDNNGANWSGTGITMRQQAVANNSIINITVNDAIVAIAGNGYFATNTRLGGPAAPTLTVSGNAISPTKMVSLVGDGLIKNITAPTPAGSWIMGLIATGTGLTFDATGNIAIAGTMVQSQVNWFWYDFTQAKWYPAYTSTGTSTGNYTFSGNTMDLSGAATMSIGPTTTTAITLGKPTTIPVPAVGTAQTAGLTVTNTTAAGAGAQQYSPIFIQEGQGWRTNATAQSESVRFAQQVRPVQGAADPTGFLDFMFSVNGGSWTTLTSMHSSGRVDFPTYITTPSGGAGGLFDTAGNLGLEVGASGLYAISVYGGGLVPINTLVYPLGDATHIWTETWTRHLCGAQTSVPTFTAGAGIGTGPTVTITGSDLAMLLDITTGTGVPGGAQTLLTVTYNAAYAVKPKAIHLAPANDATAAQWAASNIYVDDDAAGTTTAGFVIKANASTLNSTTQYKIQAIVIQ